jgi:putative addiction module component (TIGR02574 family)
MQGDWTMSSVTSSIEGAFAIAQSLTPVEKLELISRLWEDIRVRGDFRPSDSDLAEIKRRWSDYESGKVKTIPWVQVRDEIRQRLKELKVND